MENRLLIVSNRLPFQLKSKNGVVELKESDGGLVRALKSYLDSGNTDSFDSTVWIGSAEFTEKQWKAVKPAELRRLNYEIEAVFIESNLYNTYYNGFCNATVWPLFHYFPSYVEFDEAYFDAFERVNRILSDTVLNILRPGDTVWIHDYQLMLMPGMIRDQVKDAIIGFFLHIPFPSFEVFRILHRPWKEKIIHGLLGADLIGFHTHEYVQHFLKTVQMVAGLDFRFRTIFIPNRSVKAEMFPLGIDFEKFHNAHSLPEVQEQEEKIKTGFEGRKIIMSIDRLDYTKGITHRLLGFERFLDQYKEWSEKVTYIIVVVPSRQIISKYTERKKLIEEEIGRINGKFSTLTWQPIIYRYNHLSFPELTALYNTADVGLITPLRDGMNLVAKEFLASKVKGGVLVLSELAGAANELGEALLVNPRDTNEVAHAIATALNMPPEVQEEKLAVMQQRLRDYTVTHWMDDFLKQLEEIKNLQHSQLTRYLAEKHQLSLLRTFEQTNRRLLLLDYDGTLVPFSKTPAAAAPDDNLIQLLEQLSKDDRNEIYIISGRDGASLEKWFSRLPVNLVAEHGASMRLKDQEWVHADKLDQSWKPVFRPILEMYAQRSPGSFIEEKNHTLVWHYRNVHKELGFIRSRELLDNLQHMIRNSPLRIIDGNKVIEIRLAGIDKGAIAQRIVEKEAYDFILAMGDDRTDEDMFAALGDKATTIKIGAGHTQAQYYLLDNAEVLQFLQMFAELGVDVKK